MPVTKKSFFQRSHVRAVYRSGLEVAVAAALTAAGVSFAYEAVRVPFEVPAKTRHYTPDYLLHNGIIVETKGLWDADDRAKHLLVKEQHPNLDIRIVFSNPNAKLRKGSPTSYAMFCEKHGIQFAKKNIPAEWLTEEADPAKTSAVAALRKG